MQNSQFSPLEREIARETDLVAYLRAQGEVVSPSGTEYQWKCQGQKVTIRRNLWFHQYERVGGDAVGFLRHFCGLPYGEAVRKLLRYQGMEPTAPEQPTALPFELPPGNDNLRRVKAYLTSHRKLDGDILSTFIYRNMIYESAEYHNAVFVGYDREGQPRHAHKRGTAARGSFKGNVPGSLPEYSFHWAGKSERIFLFESPIDLLSFLCLHPENWQQHSYAAACSVSDRVLFQCLRDQPHLGEIYLCFDRDTAGQTAARRISDKLFLQGISSKTLLPKQKDWNEDLCVQRGGA